MSANRIVPVLSLGVLALVLAALVYGLGRKENHTFDGVIVVDFTTYGGSSDLHTLNIADYYEFYPNAKDCNYRGTPYLLLPNASFRETVTGVERMDPRVFHGDGLFHSTWRAKLNGNLSRIGRFRYRKTYWRELSVNYVVDAVLIGCSDAR
jgi:hypothetical protein